VLLSRRLSTLQSNVVALQAEKSEAIKVARAWKERAEELESELDSKDESTQKVNARLQQKEKFAEESRRVLDNAKQQIQKLKSDMEKQRARQQKEIEEIRKTAEEKLLERLLPVFDHFESAAKEFDESADPRAFHRGIQMIHKGLWTALDSIGFVMIDPKGEIFDPQEQEAVNTVAEPDLPEGAVAEVLRPGYRLEGKILRPAMVTVNKLGNQTPSPEKPNNPGTQTKPEPPAENPHDSDNDPINQALKFLETKHDL